MKPKVNVGGLNHFGLKIGVPSSEAVPASWSELSGTKEEPVTPRPRIDTTRQWGKRWRGNVNHPAVSSQPSSPHTPTLYLNGQAFFTTFSSQNTRREAIIFTQQSHKVVEGSMTAMRRRESSERRAKSTSQDRRSVDQPRIQRIRSLTADSIPIAKTAPAKWSSDHRREWDLGIPASRHLPAITLVPHLQFRSGGLSAIDDSRSTEVPSRTRLGDGSSDVGSPELYGPRDTAPGSPVLREHS